MKPFSSALRSVLAMVVAAAILASCPAALAQWSFDPLVNNPICTATGNQRSPATISDGAGGAITAWMDYRNGISDIFVQRIDADGAVAWTTDGVTISAAALGQENPRLVGDGAGGAIITWQDNRPGGSNYDIYARRITAAGAVQWVADGTPICVLTGIQGKPEIVSDGGGGAIIAWEDGRGGNYDIYVQRIDADGAVQWPANGVAVCTAAAAQREPKLVADGAGGAIITWYDQRSGDNDVYAQRVNAAGAVQWTTNGVVISTATSFQMYPAIASDGAGGAIIGWQDFRNGVDYDIYVQRISGGGTPQWTPDGNACCVAVGYQNAPVLVSDDAGGAILTWQDARVSSTNLDIYAQRVDSLGVGQWNIEAVAVSTAAGNQNYPTIAKDGSGGAIITWQDSRTGSSNDYYNDIYAQRLDALGATKWAANGAAISKAPDGQSRPKIVGDGAGGAIIVWEDFRTNPTYDIYAARISADGAPPLQLVSLTGTLLGPGIVRLDWATASEVNCYGYGVERKLTTETQFVMLPGSFVAGNGTTSLPHAYAFDDSLATPGPWDYRIVQTAWDFTSRYSASIRIDLPTSGAPVTTPRRLVLAQNRPNPFNPSTAISYTVPAQVRVTLQVFDVRGRLVATLVDGVEEAGDKSVRWDASGMASGTYFYRLQAGDTALTRKLLLLK